MSTSTRTDPLIVVLAVLTVTTGLVDAVSVLGLQRVFTANMTGNVVFLGFAVAGEPGFSVMRSLVALAGFLAGAVLGGRIGGALSAGSGRRWLLIVAAVESLLLIAAAWLAIGYDGATATPVGRLYGLIGLTAVAMGLRNATVRRLGVPDLTTTVLTLTLTGIAADSSLAGGNNLRWGRRVTGVLSILLGAAIGALLLSQWGLTAPLLLSAACVMLATVAYAWHPASAAVLTATK